MNDEKIIGPFTLLQFIYIVLGVGAVVFLKEYLSQEKLIGAGVIVAILVFKAVRQAEPPALTPEYFRSKRSELGSEKFKKWMQTKIAMVESQIAIQESKGKPVDPMLFKAKESLEKTRDELN